MLLFVESTGCHVGVCNSLSNVWKMSLFSAVIVFHGGSKFLHSCGAIICLPLWFRFLGFSPYFKIILWFRVLLALSLKLVLHTFALGWVRFFSFLRTFSDVAEFFWSAFQADGS